MAIITPEERARAANGTPQSRFRPEPPGTTGSEWTAERLAGFAQLAQTFPGILDFVKQGANQITQLPSNALAETIGLINGTPPAYRGMPVPQPQYTDVGRRQPNIQAMGGSPEQTALAQQVATGTPFQNLMRDMNLRQAQQQQPQGQPSRGLPMTADAITALGGASRTSPQAPNFTAVSNQRPEFRELPEFQNPNYTEQFTGGDLAGFLSLPEAVSFDIPQLSRAQTFGLTPDMVSGALNTELAYRKAQQTANQQNFANRVQQLGIASGMDDAAAQRFSQRLIDEARNISNQDAEYNYRYGETPEQARMRDAEVAAELARYKYDLDMDKLISSATLKLKSGDLNEIDKYRINIARDFVDQYRKSFKGTNLAEAVASGNMEAVYDAIQASGGLTPETEALLRGLPAQIEVLQSYGIIQEGTDVGVPTAITEGAIDIMERIRQIEAALQGQSGSVME